MRRPSGRILNSRCVIYRSEPTQDSNGGLVPGWVEVGRAVPCALAPAEPERGGSMTKEFVGKITQNTHWMVIFGEDRGIQGGDKIEVTDERGGLHTLFAHGGNAPGHRGAIYLVTASERV
jgi:hypothetical protein